MAARQQADGLGGTRGSGTGTSEGSGSPVRENVVPKYQPVKSPAVRPGTVGDFGAAACFPLRPLRLAAPRVSQSNTHSPDSKR